VEGFSNNVGRTRQRRRKRLLDIAPLESDDANDKNTTCKRRAKVTALPSARFESAIRSGDHRPVGRRWDSVMLLV
jgi:hypothetical protein